MFTQYIGLFLHEDNKAIDELWLIESITTQLVYKVKYKFDFFFNL